MRALLVGGGLLVALAGRASESSTHRVGVTVTASSGIEVSKGSLSMTLEVTGVSQVNAATNDTVVLSFFQNTGLEKKITVEATAEDPRFLLQVQARDRMGGQGQGRVFVGTDPSDRITGIGSSHGTAVLEYMASAQYLAVNGTADYHITYTMVDDE